MDKMRMESVDVRQKNIEKIAELFPGAITEKLDERQSNSEEKVYKKAINFDMLRQLLSEEEVAGDEAYEFTWVGKKAAMIEANTPIKKTLRPYPEEGESVNWNTTENLYIEGDNLEALKLLQESYLGKVKMIYIDPPYNTGNDFIYNDSFKMSQEEYDNNLEIVDEENNKLFKNTETNGRFHSDWCSMIYSRLLLSKNLLSTDGVIFISIDDNEENNLKKICDEIFGESNFINTVIWKKKYGIQNDAKYFSTNHDYILVYAKNINSYQQNLLPRTEEQDKRYTNRDKDPRGVWKAADLSVGRVTEKDRYEIVLPSGRKVLPPNGRSWVVGKDAFEKLVEENRIWFGEKGDNVPSVKKFLNEVKDGRTASTIWEYTEVGHTDKAKKEVNALFEGASYFDYPKPVDLIKQVCVLATNKESIVLDFFSGSATTAQAVMQLNYEDNGKRKFIMVQLPEKCADECEAARAGYKTIAEIGKERIRRAGNIILFENPEVKDLDIGFRVFKVDESNMKDVYYAAGDYKQNFLDLMESNIKEDRNDLDLLFGCILEWGMSLSLPYSKEYIDGVTIHNVAEGDLIACFEENISEEVIRKIAQKEPKPLRVVFRDSSFMNSPAKINVEEIFKLLSPNTKIKVL